MPLKPPYLPRRLPGRLNRVAALFVCLTLVLPAIVNGSDIAATQPPATSSRSVLDPTNGLGNWIWSANLHPRQTCRFWRSFEIPSSAVIVRALLRMTADNGYTLFLDGREVGRGINWRVVTEYDVTWLLSPGTHVLAVEAFNDMDTAGRNSAGVILGLRVMLGDGHVLEIGTDSHWRVVPEHDNSWQTKKHASSRWPPVQVMGEGWRSGAWQAPLKIVSVTAERPSDRHFWQTGWFQVTMLAVCGSIIGICLRLMARLALQSKAQQTLQIERARIARDIHDDLGAGLTKLVLLGEVVQSELKPDSEIRPQIAQLCEKARNLSHTMDEVVWAINSKRDTLRDFATYMCKYAQAFLEFSPTRCRLDVDSDMPAAVFDLPVRRNLFLAVKEAISNAAKHSGATELNLRIHCHGKGLRVVVEDNGRGFDPELADPERNGLGNMAQRMAEVGGSCRISAESGSGCQVEFELPSLTAQREPRWLWLWPPLRRRASRENSRTAASPLPGQAISR